MRGIAVAFGLVLLAAMLLSITAPAQYAQVPQDCPDGVCVLPLPQGVQKAVDPPVEIVDAPPIVISSSPVVLEPVYSYAPVRGVCMPALQMQPRQPVRNVARGVCSVPVRVVQAQPVRTVVRGACRVVGRLLCR